MIKWVDSESFLLRKHRIPEGSFDSIFKVYIFVHNVGGVMTVAVQTGGKGYGDCILDLGKRALH